MTQLQFEGKLFPVSEDGFVPLTSFSTPIFALSTDDLRSFFDSEDRFYKKYEAVRQGLRHNVRFLGSAPTSNGVVVCEGGVFHEDFAEFIRRARLAIHANTQAFDRAIDEWRKKSKIEATSMASRQLKLLGTKILRSLATLLRRLAGTTH